ncbi:hypothetical protein AB0C13_04505 [Streptomyces sp. NPDC049099]|uniref:hypothetical protein n=1 Tax=Streptomyces sp. NPDC049099 TaxID=3155768 RepID=UPI003435BC69
MKTTPRILAAAATGALLMAAAPAHAANGSDALDLVSTTRMPASALPGPVPLLGPLLHPETIYDSQDTGFVIENLKRDIN